MMIAHNAWEGYRITWNFHYGAARLYVRSIPLEKRSLRLSTPPKTMFNSTETLDSNKALSHKLVDLLRPDCGSSSSSSSSSSNSLH